MFTVPNIRASALRLSLLVLAAIPALSQVTASISGRIEDATGSGVASATVTVTSTETGAKRVVTSGADGSYSVAPLPLGGQEVRVEKQGFKSAVRTGLSLQVGEDAAINFRLEIGDLTQQVTVTAETPVVNTTTSPVSGVVNEQEVKDLPLNGRSFDNLIALNPGSINYGLKSANTSTSNGNTFSVSGRRPGDNLFLLNGVEYGGSSQLAVTPGGASQELLGVDAVREFNVLTEAYGAEYGKRAGAQVIVVTQSGGNTLHASWFEFLRNSALDARNFFDQAQVPPFRRNQFGGAMGGPIRRNKLFAFGNYEGFRQALAVTSLSVVPDAQARLGQVPNTATGVYSTVANLNPAMLKYFALWPAPGQEIYANGRPSGDATSYNTPHQSIREDFGTFRTDYVLSSRDNLSGAYTIDDGYNLSPLADPLFGSILTLRNQVASLQEIHTFSPTLVNSFTAGFSRAAFNFDPYSYTQFPSSLSFVTGGGPGGIVVNGGATTTGASGITSAGPNNAANVWNRRNIFTVTDDVHKVHGRHEFSFGVWMQRLRDNEDTASRQLGQATFTSLTTLLQGTVSTFQVVPNPTELGWRSVYGAWYAQDVIRVSPNLTVRLGLRHEFSTGWNEVSGRAANYQTDSNGVLLTQPDCRQFSFFTEQCEEAFWPPRRARVGCLRQRQNRGPLRLRHLLFDDRRSELPAQFAAAVQRLRLLCKRGVVVGSSHYPKRSASPAVQPHRARAMHHLRASGRAGECPNARRRRVEFRRRATAR